MRISDWSSDVCSSDLYMPDWDYLTRTSDDSLRNSSINGTYYSPSVNYAPPPTRTGDSYGDSPGITNAYKDGFLDRSSRSEARRVGEVSVRTCSFRRSGSHQKKNVQ